MLYSKIQGLLGPDSQYLLDYKSTTFDPNIFTFPSQTSIETVFSGSDRNEQVLSNLKKLYGSGRLKNSGYLSILPVDQGVEHSAGARFADNPLYFDPENIVKLALEAGCNGVTSTLGALGLVSKKYADKIPFILKLNHNEFLSYPNSFDEIMFAEVQQAKDMGAIGVGATIYFGSKESKRQIQEVSKAFAEAHRLGLFTILWCYLRNDNFKVEGVDYHFSADLTGQANYLGVTIEADIIKQKLPTNNGGYKALNTKDNPYGKVDSKIYSKLTTDHPIDLVRYQLANNFLGKIPLLNSGGDPGQNSESDQKEIVRTAVINKRAGGSGVIMGRKAFQKSFEEGVAILNLVQDVYLCEEVGIA